MAYSQFIRPTNQLYHYLLRLSNYSNGLDYLSIKEAILENVSFVLTEKKGKEPKQHQSTDLIPAGNIFFAELQRNNPEKAAWKYNVPG